MLNYTVADIKQKKNQYGYTCEQMAQLSGVPLSTVRKIMSGSTKSPRYQTIQALASVFPAQKDGSIRYAKNVPSGNSAPAEEALYSPDNRNPLSLQEPRAAYAAFPNHPYSQQSEHSKYPRQGTYTLDDYLSLPDDQRAELIDGVFYDMSAPSTVHQLTAAAVHGEILRFIQEKKGTCMPFIAPTDVQLDRDNRSIVQPDVMIVCDRSMITWERICGAPDFILEVLSPGTRLKDMLIKTKKYCEAGVREYWMADIQKETVIKYLFTGNREAPTEKESSAGSYASANKDAFPESTDITVQIYPFSTPVPVSIFQDECLINFAEIAKTYSFLSKE